MNNYIKISIILCIIVAVSLAIYFLTKKKDKSNDNSSKECSIPNYTQEDFDRIMNNKLSKNFRLSPGNGIFVMTGGNPNDIQDINVCCDCLNQASYDPSDPSANNDPKYYYDGVCYTSELVGSPGPLPGTTIAVNAIEKNIYHDCYTPGIVYDPNDPNPPKRYPIPINPPQPCVKQQNPYAPIPPYNPSPAPSPAPYNPPAPSPPTPVPYNPPAPSPPSPTPYNPPAPSPPSPTPYNPPAPSPPSPAPYNPPAPSPPLPPSPPKVDPITLSNLAPFVIKKLENNKYVDPIHIQYILSGLNQTKNVDGNCRSYYSQLYDKLKILGNKSKQ
jgi:hypothetical protein